MALDGPVEIDSDEEGSPKVANGYYQLFGVTASSYAEAVACVETALADIVTKDPDAFGWLVQLQVDTWSEPASEMPIYGERTCFGPI